VTGTIRLPDPLSPIGGGRVVVGATVVVGAAVVVVAAVVVGAAVVVVAASVVVVAASVVVVDRRVVLVEVVEAGAKLIYPFYRPIIGRLDKVHKKFSDQQLATVLRYFTESLDAMSDHVAWLQTQPALSRHRCRRPMTAVPDHPAVIPSPQMARRVGRPARRAPASRNHP